MKALILIPLLLLCACKSHPVASSGHWESLAWKYFGADGKLCGELVKLPQKTYRVDIFNGYEALVFSLPETFDSDQEAQTFLEQVCARRRK